MAGLLLLDLTKDFELKSCSDNSIYKIKFTVKINPMEALVGKLVDSVKGVEIELYQDNDLIAKRIGTITDFLSKETFDYVTKAFRKHMDGES